MATHILEHRRIAPSAAAVPEFSLPLTFFDMEWYNMPPNQFLLFFDIPSCSKDRFLSDVAPRLQSSLAATLSHFLPFAGNIIHPLKPGEKPIIRYRFGDSVSFTVAESGADFDHLTGNHSRICDEFYPLAPNLESQIRSEDSDSVASPVFAIQVTLFPNFGFSVGFVCRHSAADGNTLGKFIKAWALLSHKESKSKGSDEILNEHNLFPSYDRTVVMNLLGMDSLYWDRKAGFTYSLPPPTQKKFPTNKVRATYVLQNDAIQRLKNSVLMNSLDGRGIAHLSSFTVIAALVWCCLTLSAGAGDTVVADNEPDAFEFMVDCRGRLNPPLPETYFGNCICGIQVVLKHGELKAADGYFKASKAIEGIINEELYGGKPIFSDVEKMLGWSQRRDSLSRCLGSAGSTKLDFYAADYGWGRPKKCELLLIDRYGIISLCKSRDLEDGGVEICVSRTMNEVIAFDSVFNEFLNKLGVSRTMNEVIAFDSVFNEFLSKL